jgi:hypothetical protein
VTDANRRDIFGSIRGRSGHLNYCQRRYWESKGGRYRVRLENNWIDVPDEVLITEPSWAGGDGLAASVDGKTFIRCFMPGSMLGRLVDDLDPAA